MWQTPSHPDLVAFAHQREYPDVVGPLTPRAARTGTTPDCSSRDHALLPRSLWDVVQGLRRSPAEFVTDHYPADGLVHRI